LLQQDEMVIEHIAISLQWVMFIFPTLGLACFSGVIKPKQKKVLMIYPDFLYSVSLLWCFYCLLAWHPQQIQCDRLFINNYITRQQQQAIEGVNP